MSNPFSIVVSDPGAEQLCTTKDQQQRLGRRIVVHCPEHESLSELLGIDVPHLNIDPCQLIRSDSIYAVDDSKILAKFIHPGAPAEKAHGNTRHFDKWCQKFLSAHLLDGVSTNGHITLPEVHMRVAASPDEQIAAIARMQANDAFGGAVRRMGCELETPLTQSPEEWSGILSTTAAAMDLFDMQGPFGQAVSSPQFHWSELFEEPTCLHFIVSAEKAKTHGSYINLQISTAFEMLARHYRPVRKTLFLLDDAVSLGPLFNAVQSMELYRKFGQVIYWGFQQVSQLQQLYGKETAKHMLGMADLIQAYSVRELDDLRMFSELAGNETVADGSHSIDPTSHGELPQIRYTGNFRSRPLLRPEDIRTLPSDKQLLFYRNAPVFIADKLDYRRDKSIAKLAGPNPYYRAK